MLLVNDGVLPLTPAAGSRVAVIGELARTPRYPGAGSSAVNPTRLVSGLEALQRHLVEKGAVVSFGTGYHLDRAEPDEE